MSSKRCSPPTRGTIEGCAASRASLCSTKISHDIRREHGASTEEIEAGMLAKSKEFAEAGNKVYLPPAD